MEIKKFSEYYSINELVTIPTLDVIIDDNGIVYNNQFFDVNDKKYPLKKGNVVISKVAGRNKIVDILGMDRKSYPAGIDKNGKLVSVEQEDGVVLNKKGEMLLVPEELRKKYGKYWKIWSKRQVTDETQINYSDYVDYSDLVPIVPTGWVNVKIDMEVLKRVKRYSSSLGHNRPGFDSLISKLSELQRMSAGVQLRHRKRETIQKEMSAIILLHYINEIKDFFTPGSSGFLFESFIGGLIPNAKVIEDNTEADILAYGEKYQIKLYNNLTSSIPVSSLEVDHYIIGIKHADKIVLYLLSGDQQREDYYGKFLVQTGLSVSQIKRSNCLNFTIDLMDIESKIKSIALGLKESLNSLYDELSKFQYNIETIISGANQEGKILDGLEFKNLVDETQGNIGNMRSHLESLVKSIKFKEI
jgi:hypothetical protein